MLLVIVTSGVLYEAHSHADIHDADHSGVEARCLICAFGHFGAGVVNGIPKSPTYCTVEQFIIISSVAAAASNALLTDCKRGPPSLHS